MGIRVLIADDHQTLCDDLRCILEKEQDIEVVGEANEGRTAVDMAKTLAPDVVVMDLGIPGLSGMEATRQIKAENPTVEVVALSIHPDKLYVLAMLEAGASGYVVKAAAYDEVSRAVRAVSGGMSYLSPDIDGAAADAHFRTPSERDACAGARRAGLRLDPPR